VVCKVAIFVSVGQRKVFAHALCRSTDAGDIPRIARLSGCGAARCLGYSGRARGRNDGRECRSKKVSHGANHGCRIEVLDCSVISPKGCDLRGDEPKSNQSPGVA
jgi:hypothetical protein